MTSHISNLLAQSPVVTMLRARHTHQRFFASQLGFAPPHAIEVGVEVVVRLVASDRDAVNARLFGESELALVAVPKIDSYSSAETDDSGVFEEGHSRLHSNQEHDHEDHEVGPRFDVFEVDHSGLRATFASNRLRLDAEVIRESANLGIAGVAFTVLDTQNGVVCEAG